ncbi:MAG: hypothetical protein BM556_06325 [Bacteriovorax sp. MedPE-SWde]|nr:MAG: hypothetical protein BM556_06325 [Bacteriovorax sp. MedPE-SWde]
MNQKQTKDNFILIRGLARESGHWDLFPKTLQSRFPEANIHFIDLPGSGKYHNTDYPLSEKRLINFVHDKILTLKDRHKGTWSVIGISLGGIVSMKLLEKYPTALDYAFIINSSARGLSPFYKRLYFKVYGSFLGTLTAKSFEEREMKILNFTTNILPENEKKRISKSWAKIHSQRPIQLNNIIRQLLWAAKAKTPKSIETRMLIMAGKQDGLCHYSCSEEIAKQLNKNLSLHDHAGHDLPADDGNWVVSQINDFIRNDLDTL